MPDTELTAREEMLARAHANVIVAKMMLDSVFANLIAASGSLDPALYPEGDALPLLSEANAVAKQLRTQIEAAHDVLTSALAQELVRHARTDLHLVEGGPS